MNKDTDILYIIYIDENEEGNSGSVVRPIKMLNAFKRIGLNVKVVSGWKNQICVRRKNLKSILRWLDSNRPKFCYIEPSSGPMYDPLDIKVMKKLHKMGVPIGLFYRDAYWKFPESLLDKGTTDIRKRIKDFIIKQMSLRDLKVIKKACDVVFVPSDTFGQYFDFQKKICLPPGCEVRDSVNYDEDIFIDKEYLTFIFVGGATRRYGVDLTFEAFSRVNKDGITAKLIYVCPENQWKGIKEEVYRSEYDKWLMVYHCSGDEKLRPLYAQADVALLAAPNTEYQNFAVPVKIFEYMSYNKPILVTNSYETSRIILENNIGWSVKDSADDVCEKIKYLNENRNEVADKKRNCKEACYNNSWDVRAKHVVKILA